MSDYNIQIMTDILTLIHIGKCGGSTVSKILKINRIKF